MPSRPQPSRAPLRYAVQLERAARQFRSLPRAAREILRLCDGTRSLAAIRRASPLEREMTDRVLERLLALGLILSGRPAAKVVQAAPAVEAAPPPGPPTSLAFTDDEEAFFSRGIEHLIADDLLN